MQITTSSQYNTESAVHTNIKRLRLRIDRGKLYQDLGHLYL